MAVTPITSSVNESVQSADLPNFTSVAEAVDPEAAAGITVDAEQQEEEEEPVHEFSTFESMDLDQSILRGIYGYGFEYPSAIQKCAIVPICKCRDTLAQAQSGTGKTATFAIGALQRVDITLKATQVLILAPTRELADQICNVTSLLGAVKGVTCHASVGGTQVNADAQALSAGPHIVVGTPGRIYDMISHRRALKTDKIKIFVLDEADEMLSRGFMDQIYNVFQYLDENVQVVLVSATLPKEVLTVSEKFMVKPVRILIKNEELTLEGIRQFYINLDENGKFSTLLDLYDVISVSQSVIFCNSIPRVNKLVDWLHEKGHTVGCIHGEMLQTERSQTVGKFREGCSRVLVSTDLIARGIDVQQVSLVINFDMPSCCASYIHRIGRSGRFGRKGMAINFVSEKEMEILHTLMSHYDTVIEPAPSNLADIISGK